jgi:hypothetical protein
MVEVREMRGCGDQRKGRWWRSAGRLWRSEEGGCDGGQIGGRLWRSEEGKMMEVRFGRLWRSEEGVMVEVRWEVLEVRGRGDGGGQIDGRLWRSQEEGVVEVRWGGCVDQRKGRWWKSERWGGCGVTETKR